MVLWASSWSPSVTFGRKDFTALSPCCSTSAKRLHAGVHETDNASVSVVFRSTARYLLRMADGPRMARMVVGVREPLTIAAQWIVMQQRRD